MTVDNKRQKYPSQPSTLGEHIRKARMDRGELQKQVAQRIGVSTDTICYWENGRVAPEIRHYPALINYLGYNPFPKPDGTINALGWYKKTKGLSFRGLDAETGINSDQLRGRLTGEAKPLIQSTDRMEAFLNKKGIQ